MTIEERNDASSRGPESTGSALKCCWMVAGVVSYKLCDQRNECETCSFDHAIRNRRARLFADPGSGQIDGENSASRSVFSHPRHVWARLEANGKVRSGLDDFGRRLAGRIYCVELPEPGTRLEAGAPAWTIVHHDGKVALASPVSGIVESVNDRLRHEPSLANRDPFGDGWAMVVSPADLSGDLTALRFGADTAAWSAAESERLLREIGSTATLMDGGRLVENLHEAIPPDSRARVLELFLSATGNASPDLPESRASGEPEGR
jgi:glycine cleavage system H lipoate-binding protein